PFCVLICAFPGAMPPLIGLASSTGPLSLEAWMLYATLFFWQFLHFMAIAWMYRDDYDRAGYFVLPHGQARIRAPACSAAWRHGPTKRSLLLPSFAPQFGVFLLRGTICASSI